MEHYTQLITDENRVYLIWPNSMGRDVTLKVIPHLHKLQIDFKVEAMRFVNYSIFDFDFFLTY